MKYTINHLGVIIAKMQGKKTQQKVINQEISDLQDNCIQIPVEIMKARMKTLHDYMGGKAANDFFMLLDKIIQCPSWELRKPEIIKAMRECEEPLRPFPENHGGATQNININELVGNKIVQREIQTIAAGGILKKITENDRI